jgi:nicotinamide-nucleotide amidase
VKAEIVAVGTELLLGQITNTNARWMSEHLAAIGVDVLHHQVVGDNLDRVVACFGVASERADVVLVCGGLGPTRDDLTRDALAEFLGVPMVRHRELEELLREKFRGFSSAPMPESNLRQADVPQGCRFIVPERGTAPGLVAELRDGTRVYAVPGVPLEMIEMMEGTVLPELAAQAGGAIVSRILRCVGIGESRVGELLDDLYTASTNPSVAYLATTGEVKVRLTAKAASEREAEKLLDPLVEEVKARLGDVVFTDSDEELPQAILRLLGDRRLTLACAESLTGGGVGLRVTEAPGSSAWFIGSAVVYTADAKRAVLGVSRETLDGAGVVSEACAREMAAGARLLFGSDVAISFTGAAGPEPHGGQPPGTIWVALDSEGRTHARGFTATGERDRVRRWAEQAGLDLLRRHLEGLPLPVSDTTV